MRKLLRSKMEHLYISLVVLFVSLVSISFCFLFYKHGSRYSSPSLPPGGIGYPIVGESLTFLNSRWKGQPERFILDRMSRYSPKVFKTSILCEPMAVLCGVAGNKFLFSNENKLVLTWFPSSVNKIFPTSLQTSASEEGQKVRKILFQVMRPEALKQYIGGMDRNAQHHFTVGWENKDRVNVLPLASKYSFWFASKLFIGIEDPQHIHKLADAFQYVASGIFSVPINLPGTPFNRAIRASNLIKKEIRVMIKQRKIDLANGTASATQDILSQLLSATDDEGKHMSEVDIEDKILGLMVGGHDTISVVCTFIVKYLAELPTIYELVYKEQMDISKTKGPGELLNWDDVKKMKYSWNVACEVMRLTPPADGAFREAIHDFTFEGFFIPKGWKLYWSTYSTHHNPEYFPQPEKFDPSRFDGDGPAPYTYIPFGGGPRMCPGKEYAKLKILVFMHNLVKRFRWEKCLPDEKVVVNPLPKPAKGLPIRIYPHKA